MRAIRTILGVAAIFLIALVSDNHLVSTPVAIGQVKPRKAQMESRNEHIGRRTEVVGENETLVGVKLPPPWDVRIPKPGDQDFAAAQDAAWDVLGTALESFISTPRRKGSLSPNTVTSFESVPNVFILYGFYPPSIKALRQQPGITFVSNNPGEVKVTPPQSPREEMLIHPSQISLENPGGVSYVDLDGQPHTSQKDVDIDALGAWLFTAGKPNVVVAIIDDGFDISKPEIAANVYTNFREIPCNQIDDDGNGFIDDYQGYDFGRQTGCNTSAGRLEASFGKESDGIKARHGTAMALTMASLPRITTNSITGVAPGIRYLPIAVPNFNGNALVMASSYILAMKRAGAPIRVVNFSLGTPKPGTWECSPTNKLGTERNALGELLASDVTVVVSAGNDGSNIDISRACPANLGRSYDNVITVAAVDPMGQHPFFSNFGPLTVTTSAPGVAIYNGYGYQTGTSVATAIVSGIVALMYSGNAELSPAEIKKAIINSAKMTELNLPTQSKGIVSADKALAAAGLRRGPAQKKASL